MLLFQRICSTTLLNQRGIHQKIRLFYGLTVDLVALAWMVSSMNMGHLISQRERKRASCPLCISILIAGLRYLILYIWILLLALASLTAKTNQHMRQVIYKQLRIHTNFFSSGWRNIKNSVQIHFMFLENLMLEFTSQLLLLKFMMFIFFAGIKAGEKPVINFKGYMIGNGVTDPKFDGNALVPFAHGMALISDDLFEEVKAACGGNYYSEPNQNCLQKLGKVDNAIGYLNIYDILEPCYHSPPSSMKNNIPNSTFGELGKTERPLPVRKRMFGRAWPFKAPVLPGIVPSWPQLLSSGSVPCIDDEVATAWLNDESVRKALHAVSKNETGEWQLCTTLGYSHDAGSMLTYHKNLTMQGYRALIYSGDHDMCVPFTGTQAWTRSLGYNIVEEWRPWYPTDQDVASGYLQGYDHNLTFLTIKGAGHTVPEYKPRESLHFYSRWLVGENI
ncbi:hypothetical protein EZV62_024687 [Acer yangbiense]|uniref:Carboxypeptidase n=1 Tax=Acer yangbiense TaxID=1000413 RepID=A0A5C7GWV8_9ROSI|nr:hypothetical protein EZV62_024687 [Acer yangbiense]